MVDPRRVASLLERLRQTRRILDELAAIPGDELAADLPRLGGAKYYLLLAAEICIDVANHVIASKGLRRPRDFADAFAVLREAGLLDEELATKMASMARFRNLLVHEYGSVDDGRVVEILSEGRADLDAFASAAARLALD